MNNNNTNKQNGLIITKEGLEKLKLELKELTEFKRPQNLNILKDAREMGDLSENSMYDVAREEQAFIEGKIVELEEIIKNAIVTDHTTREMVGVGSKVTVHIDGGEETFHIVGAPEADPMNKKISHESPLGISLIGKKIGEKIDVETPIGIMKYTILGIE